MVMMFIRFGEEESQAKAKKKVMGLTNALEIAYLDSSRMDSVVDAASELCGILKGSEVSLTMSEKIRVLKSVTRAKVKAFKKGASDNYRTYKTLDSISGDLLEFL